MPPDPVSRDPFDLDPPGGPLERDGPLDLSGPLDEDALARALEQRRVGALAALYDHYGGRCYALARRIVVDEQLAQDVVQEAFLTVWRSAGDFERGRGSLSAWLLTVTHHRAVDLVRHEQRHRTHQVPLDDADRGGRGDAPVDELAADAVRGGQVRAALRQLPEAQRESLLLAYFGGYTQSEIAQLTATPLGTVKTRMFTGLRKLRELLASTAAEEV